MSLSLQALLIALLGLSLIGGLVSLGNLHPAAVGALAGMALWAASVRCRWGRGDMRDSYTATLLETLAVLCFLAAVLFRYN